jgi:hypothetical protein
VRLPASAPQPGDVEGGLAPIERLDACEHFARDADVARIVAGVNTGRVDAYRRMLARGFRAAVLVGLAMRRPNGPDYDRPQDYVIDDLR